MTFILDTTIGLGIWLPFMIGKSSALLTVSLDVSRVVGHRSNDVLPSSILAELHSSFTSH